MTLLELLVALAILSLCAGLVFSNLGPWLAQSRQARTDASFWGSLAPAALTLSELSAAAIDPAQRSITADDAQFSVYLPRLAPAPTRVELQIETTPTGASLLLRAPTLPQASLLLESNTHLRFAPSADALFLEAFQQGSWRRVAVAAFIANAPMTCAFDSISRRCR